MKRSIISIVLLCVLYMEMGGATTESPPKENNEKKCCCYVSCDKKYGGSDGLKASCQRGCRLFSLVLHISHLNDNPSEVTHASNGCFSSCIEGYFNPLEAAACQHGCASVTTQETNCVSLSPALTDIDISIPPINVYSIFVESETLMEQGDTSVLYDPGLRKQYDRTWSVVLDNKVTLPETHFRNLPITETRPEREKERRAHVNLNCPKLYVSSFGFNLPQRMHANPIKFMFSDIYVLIGVFCTMVMVFMMAANMELRTIVKMIARWLGKHDVTTHQDYEDEEADHIVKVQIEEEEEMLMDEEQQHICPHAGLHPKLILG